jgi:hypothetical protein
MTTAVHADSAHDLTDVPRIVRYSAQLGILQSVAVFLVSLANRYLEGTADAALTGIIVAVGAVATIFLPGLWTRARSIEGIGGAAGIGLGAALVFLVLDVVVLQPLGTYTNRWYEVGGHSNWWYHPVWWMVGSYLSWLGAFILSNQAAGRGTPSLGAAIGLVALLTAVLGAAAAMVHFPGASWSVPTFAVAVLPALALGTIVSGLGSARN